MKITSVLLVVATALGPGLAESGRASVIVYSAFDDGQASPIGSNSLAEEQAFRAAAGSLSAVTFEAPLPSDVHLGGTAYVTSQSPSAFRLYGGDTTPGGGQFLNLPASLTNAILTFNTPISTFGAYFSGLQLGDDVIEFNDGAPQSITLPADYVSGGMAFVGFTDFGAAITSVEITVTRDLIGVDDVLYGQGESTGAVPEASTWAMMAVGFAMAGLVHRRRRAQSALPYTANLIAPSRA